MSVDLKKYIHQNTYIYSYCLQGWEDDLYVCIVMFVLQIQLLITCKITKVSQYEITLHNFFINSIPKICR